jgi:hypothetical protein
MLSWMLRKSTGELTWSSGVAVRLLMEHLRIPEEYWNEFGANFAKSWRLSGWDGQLPNKAFEDFECGILNIENSRDDTQNGEGSAVTETNKDDHEGDYNSDETMMVEPTAQAQGTIPEQEQALIDAQLHAELASLCPDDASHSTISTHKNEDEVSGRSNMSPEIAQARYQSVENARPNRYARPRSSSLFTFEPGAANRLEARNSRDVSLARTELLALDTFTAELLAKAEEY